MKKQLIAMAVAAAFAGPVVAQTTISATVDLGIDLGSENAGNTFASGTVSTTELRINSVEDLGGGLKAFVDIHTGFGNAINGLADANEITVELAAAAGSVGDLVDAGGVTATQSAPIEFGDRGGRIGLSGQFGTVAFGRTTGTAFNSMRGGVAGNLSNLSAGSVGSVGARVNNAIDYSLPSFSGTTLRGILDTETSEYEISVVSNIAGVSAQAGYARSNTDADWVVRLGYKVGDVGLNVVYQDISNEGDWYSLGATYTMGAVQLVAEGQRRNDASRSIIGGTYNLSKRTNAYVMMSEGVISDDTGTEGTRVFVGMRHTF